jgi:hypothetical protein
MGMSAPTTPPGRTGRRRRIDLGVFGKPTVAGLIGLLGLLVAVASALIAYLDWQGNVAERAAAVAVQSSPAPSFGPIAPSGLPTGPSSPTATPGTARSSTATGPTSIAPTTTAPAADLSYRLNASAIDSHTVKVTATASGRPQPGLTYWFVLEVNWGGGNVDYYPRRPLGGTSSTFEVPIPAGADPHYARQGRIYALTNAQNTRADAKVDAQSTTQENDYFDNATGQVVSNAVKLPY